MQLVVANSITTLITVPLVFLLPRLIVSRKDAELYEEAPALKTAMDEGSIFAPPNRQPKVHVLI